MRAKRIVLEYIAQAGLADSAGVADALGYTRSGAASMLLRYHRHGQLLRRRAEAGGYEYAVSEKGESWLRWAESA